MRTTIDHALEAGDVDPRNVQKLVVTWQHPESREVWPVGLLAWDEQRYTFDYLAAAGSVEDFRPLLGFPDMHAHYEALELFPIFQERVLDPRRPDFSRYVSDLKLDASTASPWEQLARSGGGSESDTLQLYPVPTHNGDACCIRFLVNGVRHLATKSVDVRGLSKGGYTYGELEAVLASLQRGQALSVAHELTNQYSSSAVLVLTSADMPIGYVPNWLAREILPLVESDALRFVVDQVNPLEAGWHLRVLVLLEMELPLEYSFLIGDRWVLASA